MLRTKTEQVHADLTGVHFKAGGIEVVDSPGGYGSVRTTITVPMNTYVLGAKDEYLVPDSIAYRGTPIVLHCPPSHMRAFCEDVLEQLERSGH